MKETFGTALVVLVGLVGVIALVSWAMTVWWSIRFYSVKSQVISEMKPFLPSIEKDLGFFSDSHNQNAAIPPLLKSLASSHELSEKLSVRTRKELNNSIDGLSLWLKSFLISCGLVVLIMLIAMSFIALFPDVVALGEML